MKRMIIVALVLITQALSLQGQTFYHQKIGDTVRFFLPLEENDDLIIIDSTAISLKTKKVICDLRGKGIYFRTGSEANFKFLPYRKKKVGCDLDYLKSAGVLKMDKYCQVADAIDSGCFKEYNFANTNPEANYSLLLEALGAPGETVSSKAYEAYSYIDWSATKTNRHLDVCFSEGKFSVSSNRVSSSVLPWETLAIMAILILCSIIASQRYHKDWLDKQFVNVINRQKDKKVDSLPSRAYLDICILGSFLIALCAVLPSTAISSSRPWEENFFLIWCAALASFILMIPMAAISRQAFRINRSYGILSIAFLSCALLLLIYGFSYWIYLPVTGALIGSFIDLRMHKSYDKLLSEKLTEHGESKSVSV